MRKLLRCATAAALLLCAQEASAQMGWGMAAGAVLPMGDWGDVLGSGYHLTALGTKRPAGLPVGLRFEGVYTSFAADVAPKYSGFSGVVNATLESGSMVQAKPYLIAGAGMYSFKVSGASGSTNLGFNVGAGLRVPLKDHSMFAEIRFVNVMSDPSSTTYIPITFGVTW